jgi:hypothetical protein
MSDQLGRREFLGDNTNQYQMPRLKHLQGQYY